MDEFEKYCQDIRNFKYCNEKDCTHIECWYPPPSVAQLDTFLKHIKPVIDQLISTTLPLIIPDNFPDPPRRGNDSLTDIIQYYLDDCYQDADYDVNYNSRDGNGYWSIHLYCSESE